METVMTIDQVEAELWREPFIPFRVHLTNGKKYDIAFRDAARLLTFGFLVFIGKKEGTHSSKGYDRFPYDWIERIEHRPAKKSKRKKAS
jgi:hypothetical protein